MKRSDGFQRAKERLEARRGFFVHLTVFVAVIAALAIVNLLTSPDYFWAKWPLMGWGIGVVFHGLSVFVLDGRFAITDEMVLREMNDLEEIEHELSAEPRM